MKQTPLFGEDMFGNPIEAKVTSMLAKQFIVPPFSVLDARQGYWQERKSAWISLGIQSELGRGGTNNPGSDGDLRADTGHGWVHFDGESKNAIRKAFSGVDGDKNLTWGPSPAMKEPNLNYYRNREKDKRLTWVEGDKPRDELDDTSQRILKSGRRGGIKPGHVRPPEQDGAYVAWKRQAPRVFGTEGNISEASGTSIFDPVLCEIAYKWFCPPGGMVLDPFAGGSVRGIVASLLGYSYWGCELASGQVAANIEQARVISPTNVPTWVTGDSRVELANSPEADLVFTCPPYGSLERYSEDPRDLSTMDYPDFISELKNIFGLSVARLKSNRFVCVVVGDFRDEKGNYYGFVADTVRMFRELGLRLYNDAVLVTAVGSLPLRVNNQFAGERKLGKTHQNVLIFLKGDVPNMGFPSSIQ